MPRPGTTAQRGYDAAHNARARELKAALRDGQPCCRCGGPMYRWQLEVGRNDVRGIDADHRARARVLGGELPDALAHRRCNRSAGAVLGNQLRGARRRGHPPGRGRSGGATGAGRARPARARELPAW